MNKARLSFLVLASLLGGVFLMPQPAAAAWPTDPLVNVPVCVATGEQGAANNVTDGAGGTIIVWQDTRNNASDLYAQRVSAAGAPLWTANGVPVCAGNGIHSYPRLVADGAGGAIVTWIDARNGAITYDIYAQRLNGSGVPQWAANWVALCTAAGDQIDPAIAANGAGGAIVAWADYRTGTSYHIYAQNISGAGVPQWTVNGVALCTAARTPSFVLAWGSHGSAAAQFNFPAGVAVDQVGNVYVADQSNHRIQKFDLMGNLVLQWGSNGTGNGQFMLPTGVATDVAGNVYVADLGNNRIQEFTATGGYLTKWGSAGSGNGQFSLPSGVTVDIDGNVYVADGANHRIQKFTAAGVYLTKWGSLGSGNGQFSAPYGVGTDADGNVYVADQSNNRIQKFTSAGAYVAQWGGAGGGSGQMSVPTGITIDALGNVFVADRGNHRIQQFTRDGVYVTVWGSSGVGNGQFNNPGAVTVNASGDLFVADVGNDRIQRFATQPVGEQFNAAIAPDGAGGAIVTWRDSRNGVDSDLYAQRVAVDGVTLWPVNGAPLCRAAGDQYDPSLIGDGAGGAIVAWIDYRSGSGAGDLYAQRVGAAGAPLWAVDGVAFSLATGNPYAPSTDGQGLVSDGAGGVIAVWQDTRDGINDGIYAQRISASGASQWTANGVALCAAPDYRWHPRLVSDGAGGAIAAWYDLRNGTDSDIYAQRVNAAGAAQWTANGVALCTAPGDQQSPRICPDASGGAIVVWSDYRSGTSWDVYAQRVPLTSGPASVPDAIVLSVRGCPNPFNPRTTLRFTLPGAGPARLTVYDVAGRAVRTLVDDRLAAGSHEAVWDGRDGQGRGVASGGYLARLEFEGKVETARLQLVR